jgi:hypothetical protein
MNRTDITYHRLNNQQIIQTELHNPGEVVSWLGAVQAQDFLSSKWAIGLRLDKAKEKDVDKAIADKSIVRTWAMRGTLHFVPPADIRWMLKLAADRVFSMYASNFKRMELDEKTLRQSQEIIIKALEGGGIIGRNELKEVLSRHSVNTSEMRYNFILLRASLEGIICFGPRRNKEYTFVLLDEWLPGENSLSRDESIAELARRYFLSHGPATIADFSWWSGLTQADCKRALESIKHLLNKEEINGYEYWMPKDLRNITINKRAAYLLPPFDEYLVSYKDKTAAVAPDLVKKVLSPPNGLYPGVIVMNGQVVGTWKRTLGKNNVEVNTHLLMPLKENQLKAVEKAVAQYSKFLGYKKLYSTQ